MKNDIIDRKKLLDKLSSPAPVKRLPRTPFDVDFLKHFPKPSTGKFQDKPSLEIVNQRKLKAMNPVCKTNSRGDEYNGEMKGSFKHGFGTMTYKDGKVYEGQWALDCPQGNGMLTYPNGVIYQGNFNDGEKHGPGIMHYPDKSRVIGEWSHDILSRGTVTLKDSTKIKGTFTDFDFSGNGTIKFANGNSYSGTPSAHM